MIVKYNLSAICKLANRIVKGGIKRSEAFKRAWMAAKQGLIEKVAGVTFGNRQLALQQLDRCSKKDIEVRLYREPDNPADSLAVAVVVAVKGQNHYRIGYLPHRSAAVIASLMDQDVQFMTVLQGIVGGLYGHSYGMRIRIQV